MEETVALSIVSNVDQAVDTFKTVIGNHLRSTLTSVVNRLCNEELIHVLEIVGFLEKYQSSNPPEGTQVLIVGVEELLNYVRELKQCPRKSGCLLLVYSLLNKPFDIPKQYQNQVNQLKHSLDYIVSEMAELLNHPANDELIAVAALFKKISYCVLRQLFEAAYTDRCEVRNVCDFIEHLPCIDQQIQACLVLHQAIEKEPSRLQSGLMVLAYRINKIEGHKDFDRAMFADELRRLKMKLPKGVYAIVWNYASIYVGLFMACNDSFEQIGDVKCKTVCWLETATHQAKHEFITADRGISFSIRNTSSGLFLTDIEGNFCYVEKTTDTWRVEVALEYNEHYHYKLTNSRTESSIRLPLEFIKQNSKDQEIDYDLLESSDSLSYVFEFKLGDEIYLCVIQ